MVLPELAARAGLRQDVPVSCGIHDSNASLLPHLLTQAAPFAVVSTGTWVVSMAVGGQPVLLVEARDTLINVDARGDAVPSARFMGGREYAMLGGGKADADDAVMGEVLGSGCLLLPSVIAESGPFPGTDFTWVNGEPASGSPAHEAVVSFYLALMTAEGLAMTGAAGRVIVEGPFAANPAYLAMLEAASGLPVFRAGTRTGTSIGAAMLFGKPDEAGLALARAAVPECLAEAMARYATLWRDAVAGRG